MMLTTCSLQQELSLEEIAEQMERSDDELSMAPTSPRRLTLQPPAEDPEFPGQARPAVLPGPADPALLAPAEVLPPDGQPPIIHLDEPELAREPSIMATAPATPANALALEATMPDVTSTDLNLYEPAATMDFRQRRQQMDRRPSNLPLLAR